MSYTKEIYINVSIGSTRIAILENDVLVELYIDIADHKRMVGNIYRGKIQNVIPGMQAAFIDIGHSINAFLPFTEIGEYDAINDEPFSLESSNGKRDKKFNIEIGDEIIVQVIKEPFSGKGARVTTDISIPGSFMVLVPNTNYIGISKKISDRYERSKIKKRLSFIFSTNVGKVFIR